MKSFSNLYVFIVCVLLAPVPSLVHAGTPACAGGIADLVKADLNAAQQQKAGVAGHLDRVRGMMVSTQNNPDTSDQTRMILKEAESKDLDALAKLNQRISADQTCLQSPGCTLVVNIVHITGQVVLVHGTEVRTLHSACQLQPGDVLRTGVHGSADIVILGGARLLHLGSDMEFKIPAVNMITHLLEDPETELVIGVRG